MLMSKSPLRTGKALSSWAPLKVSLNVFQYYHMTDGNLGHLFNNSSPSFVDSYSWRCWVSSHSGLLQLLTISHS